jgi:two-component system, OmpR family, KDP operon response regulator KdpE
MGVNPLSVLVIDDEPPIRRLLRTSLAAHDYRVSEAETGRAALALLARDKPDLVILDLGLPDLDGIEVLRRIRAHSKVPVVVLSSRGDEAAKVEALELGADDYVTKPFGLAELLARLRAALRHGFHEKGEEPVFESGDLMVDLVRRRVTVGGAEVKLSPTEFAMLQLLVVHAGKVLTHQQILREIWGNSADVQYLRVYVRQLRRKLELDPALPRHILTEPGVGYRLQLLDRI